MWYKGTVLETLNEKAEKSRAIQCRILKTSSSYNENIWERNFGGKLGKCSWEHTTAIHLWELWTVSVGE